MMQSPSAGPCIYNMVTLGLLYETFNLFSATVEMERVMDDVRWKKRGVFWDRFLAESGSAPIRRGFHDDILQWPKTL